jgi:hypothetical protein
MCKRCVKQHTFAEFLAQKKMWQITRKKKKKKKALDFLK